jgi:hypothetical protein
MSIATSLLRKCTGTSSFFQRSSTSWLTGFTLKTLSSAEWKLTFDARGCRPARSRSTSMKVILSGAPAHLSGVAGRVISALPPFCRNASIACQVACAACGLG